MFDIPPSPVPAVVSAASEPAEIAQQPVIEVQNSVITELPVLDTKSAEVPENLTSNRSVITELTGLSPVPEPANDPPLEHLESTNLDPALQVLEPGVPVHVESTWQAQPVGQDIRIVPSAGEMQARQESLAKRRQILQERLNQLVTADPRRQGSQVAAAATKPILKPAVRRKLQPLLTNIQVARPQPQLQESAVAPVAPAQAVEPAPQRNETSYLSPASLAIAAPTSAGQGTYSNQSGYGVVTPVPPLPQMQFPGTQTGTSLIYPLQQVVPITSKFGWRVHPISGSTKFHAGVDLGGPYGAPILATHPGQVVLAESNGGYGLCVMIRFADGSYQTLYGHLSQIGVRRGQWVQQGQVIGKLGSSGYSTGPHLHFELQQNQGGSFTAIDPMGQLRYAQQRMQQQATMPYVQGAIKVPTATISGLFRL